MSSPISKTIAKELLKNNDSRDDFLMSYTFFNSDGNINVYRSWIFKNLYSKSNVIIEHVFKLASYCNVNEEIFIKKIECVLRGKYWQFAKLSCLEFLLCTHSEIENNDYILLNTLGFKHTRNELIKFQSYINLTMCKPLQVDSLEKIRAILKMTPYPTLFYRLINQFDFLSKEIIIKIKELIFIIIESKKFNRDVIREIKNLLDE